jgi:hypothetical protein
MENLVSNIRNKLTGTSFNKNSETNNLGRIQIPQMKIGLGSTEGDLIAMVKKYFEIVGLVFFVWILGKNNYSDIQINILEF